MQFASAEQIGGNGRFLFRFDRPSPLALLFNGTESRRGPTAERNRTKWKMSTSPLSRTFNEIRHCKDLYYEIIESIKTKRETFSTFYVNEYMLRFSSQLSFHTICSLFLSSSRSRSPARRRFFQFRWGENSIRGEHRWANGPRIASLATERTAGCARSPAMGYPPEPRSDRSANCPLLSAFRLSPDRHTNTECSSSSFSRSLSRSESERSERSGRGGRKWVR